MISMVRRALALVALCFFVGMVSAVPPLPVECHGSVTIDGAPAPTATEIRAVINGVVKGEYIMSTPGVYGGSGTFDQRLVVNGNEDDVGETITFTLNGVTANQTATFISGSTGEVNLSASGMVRALPGSVGAPCDLDMNGMYEDINGNGRNDFADVVLFFNQMNWVAVNEPICVFDYNINGRIDFADVVWLFNHL